VRDTFPEAWGKSAEQSRLMHSAGIEVMGALMDQIMIRADSTANPVNEVRASLQRIASSCRWTKGRRETLGWDWNEVQNTPPARRGPARPPLVLDRRLGESCCMKFIFADSLDHVDPVFDFIADRSPAKRQPYWDDAYPA